MAFSPAIFSGLYTRRRDVYKHGKPDWASWHTDTHTTHLNAVAMRWAFFLHSFSHSIVRRTVIPARERFHEQHSKARTDDKLILIY